MLQRGLLRRPFRIVGTLVMTAACLSMLASRAEAQAKPVAGSLTGVVRDFLGTPQMGASVQVLAEAAGVNSSNEFLTNTLGIFRGEKLAPGLYTVRVTLAGFLPTLQQHVRINANLTTMVRIEMESMFATLEQLRKQPNSAKVDADDWKWVLRSASGTRPVLQWDDYGAVLSAGMGRNAGAPKMLMEFTDGARRPGSVSNVAAAPGTAFAYDQPLGEGKLLVAGQMSYEQAPAGGVATIWLPSGTIGAGPHTALVLREAALGNTGVTFRGMRLDQGGALTLGDRMLVRYGGEYLLVGLGRSVSSVRPRINLETKISDLWRASVVFASQPGAPNSLDSNALEASGDELQSSLVRALDELDAFPALMWRDGRPVLQGGWHEEISAERRVGERGKLQIAAFHDDAHHLAVFGRGSDLPEQEYFQDIFSNAFAYDGGAASSWGGRVAFREKLGDDTELTAVYAVGGALAPNLMTDAILRDALRMAARQSVGVNVATKVPRSGGRVTLGYKWISGPAISRVDSYGESLYQMDPYLHVSLRQQLPKFGPGRWEAIADCDNLLAQGYVTMNIRDGQVVLVPAFRTFRGGLSLQF
ncbi:MAG TPA: carboxypeptidase-like regulatory domain-containing protein [Candidatus Eisenbacteria bacterium]|nr:carboxypeptidase-like regulatory domain-containing protein [Candidatus Eisenbacteria bacterium]